MDHQIYIPSGARVQVCGHFLRRRRINKSRPIIHHYTKHPPSDAQKPRDQMRSTENGRITPSRPIISTPKTQVGRWGGSKFRPQKPPDPIRKPPTQLDLHDCGHLPPNHKITSENHHHLCSQLSPSYFQLQRLPRK